MMPAAPLPDSTTRSLPTMELRAPLPGLLKRLVVVAMLGAPLLLLSMSRTLGKPKKDLPSWLWFWVVGGLVDCDICA
jgi:hypothetical protein